LANAVASSLIDSDLFIGLIGFKVVIVFAGGIVILDGSIVPIDLGIKFHTFKFFPKHFMEHLIMFLAIFRYFG